MLCAAPPGHPLQKRTVVQWDIDGVLSADYAADESVFPQFGISHLPRAASAQPPAAERLGQTESDSKC